jgi:tetratricopeptide (TPR) repeat protein
MNYYNNALQIEIKHYSKDNIELASTYYRIGEVCYYQGKLEEAIKNYNNALDI